MIPRLGKNNNQFVIVHRDPNADIIQHHGIKGQRWGIRRFQNEDGSLTEDGRKRYSKNRISYRSDDIVFCSGKLSFDEEIPGDVKNELDRVIKSNASVIVGDAPGADTRIQDYLAKSGYKNVTVYTTDSKVRSNVGNWKVKKVSSNGFETEKEIRAQKDIAMSKLATKAIAISSDDDRPDSAQSKNIKRLMDFGKPIQFYDYKKKTLKEGSEINFAHGGCVIIHRDPNADIIQHHGIKGQRWGIRRFQNEDGSLTPEGKRRYHTSEEAAEDHKDDIVFKAGTEFGRVSIKKNEKFRGNYDPTETAKGASKGLLYGATTAPISAGMAVDFTGPIGALAAAGGTVAGAATLGAIIGMINGKTSNYDRRTYVYDKNDEVDSSIYRGPFAAFLGFLQSPTAQTVYDSTIVAANDLVSPGQQKRVDLFIDSYRKKPAAFNTALKTAAEWVNENEISGSLPEEYKGLVGKATKNMKKLTDQELRDYGYLLYQVSGIYPKAVTATAQNQYYKTLKKAGYNAVIDDHNKDVYNGAKNPLIVLDAKKNLKKISEKELTVEEISDNLKKTKERNDKAGRKTGF